jgi:DNA-binding MarR family transcriptional regulator
MDSPMHDELISRLRDLTRTVRMSRRQRVRRHAGVPAGMLDVLMLLGEVSRRSPCCHARELVERTGLDPSTVSRAVTVLVEHGLVERRADPADKRAHILAVTPAGQEELSAASGWYEDVLRRALADWRPEDITRLSALLGRLNADVQDALGPTRTHVLEAAR